MLLDFNWSFGCPWERNIYGSVFGTKLRRRCDPEFKSVETWSFVDSLEQQATPFLSLNWCDLTVHLREWGSGCSDQGHTTLSPQAGHHSVFSELAETPPAAPMHDGLLKPPWLHPLLFTVSGNTGTCILSFTHHPEAGRPVPSSLSPSPWGLVIVFDRLGVFPGRSGAFCGPYTSACRQEALAVVAPSLVSWLASPASSPSTSRASVHVCVCVQEHVFQDYGQCFDFLLFVS